MNESLFVQFGDWFKSIADTINERINGKKTAMTYMYKQMLSEELSVDLKWNTLQVNSNIVAADVVSMDSPASLKKRDSFGKASGDIPKLSMKFKMSEKNLSDIDVLKNRNVETSIIVDKIFNDEVRATMGVHEKLEYIFLKGFSSGLTVIDDENNVGSGVRIDYGYPAENKFGVETAWSDPNSKPIDDIKRVMKDAKRVGTRLRYMFLDEATFDNIAMNAQTKEQFAFSQGFVGSNIPTPDFEQVNALLQRRLGLTMIIIDRTITVERDGKRTVLTPWEANHVVLTETTNVGKLMYGILAEETRQSPKALYTKSGSFILLKKWSTDEPFAEFTSSQALAVPVIDNVNDIYLINSEEASAADVQTEGDANFSYDGTNYTKQSVVDGINAAREVDEAVAEAKITNADSTLQNKINQLSEKGIELFEAELVPSV
jgi:hypothetical protein